MIKSGVSLHSEKGQDDNDHFLTQKTARDKRPCESDRQKQPKAFGKAPGHLHSREELGDPGYVCRRTAHNSTAGDSGAHATHDLRVSFFRQRVTTRLWPFTSTMARGATDSGERGEQDLLCAGQADKR